MQLIVQKTLRSKFSRACTVFEGDGGRSAWIVKGQRRAILDDLWGAASSDHHQGTHSVTGIIFLFKKPFYQIYSVFIFKKKPFLSESRN